MHTIDGNLQQRVVAFRQILLKSALFEEAHSLGVAISTPKLCDSAYTSGRLRTAAAVAVQLGLSDVSQWITDVILERVPPF